MCFLGWYVFLIWCIDVYRMFPMLHGLEIYSMLHGLVGWRFIQSLPELVEKKIYRRHKEMEWIKHGFISKQFGYGSIPINTIFRGMTIHLPTILMFTRGIGFWPIPISGILDVWRNIPKLNELRCLFILYHLNHFNWSSSIPALKEIPSHHCPTELIPFLS